MTFIFSRLKLRATSKHLAVAALILWLISLMFPAFVLYRYQKPGEIWYGWTALLLGWNAVWMLLSFGWLANITFLLSLVRLWRGWPRQAAGWAMAGCGLGLDTLRFSFFPQVDAGGWDKVFGFGVGAVIWYCSLCVLWFGAAQGLYDERKLTVKPLRAAPWQRAGAIVLFIAALSGSIAKGAYDRSLANTRERSRLADVVFKRGAVCSAEAPHPLGEPLHLSGPLLVESTVPRDWARTFWDSPLDLLGWGIPVVRVGNMDYRLHGDDKYPIIGAQVASGKVAATLMAFEEKGTDSPILGARLSVPGETNPRASFIWSKIGHEQRLTCPEIESEDGVRKPIAQSIANLHLPKYPLSWNFDALAGHPDPLVDAHFEPSQDQIVSESACPSDIHITTDTVRDDARLFGSRGVIGLTGANATYYLPTGSRHGVTLICSSGAAFLMDLVRKNSTSHEKKATLRVLKVALPDPKVEWQWGAVLPQGFEESIPVGIEERDGRVWVGLTKSRETSVVIGNQTVFQLLHDQ